MNCLPMILGLVLASPLLGQQDNNNDTKKGDSLPRVFMRLAENKDGGRLEVLVATYKRGDATVTLCGCVHIADRSFYQAMQKRFEAYDALLYELIADADLRPYPGMPRDGGHWISMVQDGMGSGLKLQEQFECMDYRQDNFVHADMTGEQWQDALSVAGTSELGEVLSIGSQDVDREAEAKQQPVDLVKAFRSGGGISHLRIILGRVMCSPESNQQPTVIIHGRNERCLKVLQEQLDAGKKKLGVFYGAAHMQHMEQRLLRDLGWKKVREEWVMAWDCRHSSFPKAEKGLKTKRYRARRDLRKLAEAVKQWCVKHEDLVKKRRAPTWLDLREDRDNGKLPGRADGKDSWGRAYLLRILDGGFEVRCLGSDGKPDTEDDLVESGVHKSGGGLSEMTRKKEPHELLRRSFKRRAKMTIKPGK